MTNYKIKWGDTLSGLARRFGTTVSALAKANNIADPNKILAGAQLRIRDFFDRGGARTSARAVGGDSFTPASSKAVAPPSNNVPGNVGDWIRQAQAILAAAGVPADKMNANAIAMIIQHESGGNPNAQNNWDSNAAKGTPSIGLMQTIQPTFDSYRLPGHDDIRNPVDNIIAGVRYAISRYGSVSNVPGVVGVNSGGSYVGY